MEITVVVNNCSQCRHRNHSGQFTPGGAKDICGYPGISEYVTKTNPNVLNDDPNGFDFRPTGKELKRLESQSYHWKNRIVEDYMDTDNIFPIFCPLQHGAKY